jgi:2-polyprenyl-3-methyl-5-hydroxy-6-metoxy-1,4-benzoquinol methylase
VNHPVPRKEFERLYRQATKEVLGYWTAEMQSEIAMHNNGWAPGAYDFRVYLEASLVRYYHAYLAMCKGGCAPKVCDIGGFWGVFPIALRSLGFDVTMTESLQYYSGSFNRLFDYVRSTGVVIEDYDPFHPDARLAAKFDFITVMAVLEHYPHSLKDFMANAKSLLSPQGKLYIEVPNIAFWPKRIGLLRGNSPLAPIGNIYRSKVPFIGHHHEFTMTELRQLVSMSGLKLLSTGAYNYSPDIRIYWKTILRYPLQTLAFLFLEDSRECLTTVTTPIVQ